VQYHLVYNDKQVSQVHYLNVTLNGTVILECDFDTVGLPIQWFMNGSLIDFTVSTSFCVYVTALLFILSLSIVGSCSMHYVCMYNSRIRDSTYFMIKVW